MRRSVAGLVLLLAAALPACEAVSGAQPAPTAAPAAPAPTAPPASAATAPALTTPTPVPSPSDATTASPPDPTTTPPPERGATFRYALGEPTAIVPGDVTDPSGLVVVDTLFDSLTRMDASGALQPAAATSWRADTDLRVWTFRLRRGATFHDGTPVTAADFVRSWDRAVAERRDAGYHLRDVAGYDAVMRGETPHLAGLTAVDPTTLRVELRAPFADFPTVAGHPALGPLPAAATDPGFPDQPVGNGPFRMDGPWAHGQFVRVVRAEGWRTGPPVALDEVVFQVMDAETAYIAFQQGRVDFAPLPPGALAEARRRSGSVGDGSTGPGVLDGPTAQVYLLAFDERVPPFDDPDVRRAVALAIDRAELAAALGPEVRPALRLVPQAVPDARRTSCELCVADPDEAERLFAAAGVERLPLWFNQGGGHEEVAEALGRQLARVGVRLVPRTPPAGAASPDSLTAYLDVLRRGEAGLFRFGWTLDHPTTDDALVPLLSSRSADQAASPGGVSGNYGPYRRADVDELLATARATAADTTRRRLYRQAEDLAVDRDAMFVPLLTFTTASVVADRVVGFVLPPTGLVDLAAVSVVEADEE